MYTGWKQVTLHQEGEIGKIQTIEDSMQQSQVLLTNRRVLGTKSC